MMRFELLLLMLVVFGGTAFGQEAVRDSSAITVRSPAPEIYAEAVEDRAETYGQEVVDNPSLWSLFWNWVWRTLRGWFGEEGLNRIINIGFYVLFGVCVVYVILKLLQIDVQGVVSGKKTSASTGFRIDREELEELDLEALRVEASEAGRWREAVRYTYLAVLRDLADLELIAWRREKTNREYVRELARPDLRRAFARLTRLFEYTWYGEKSVEAEAYAQIEAAFARFRTELEAEAEGTSA